ncbi:MAG: CBS domain-containing protein [SAR324 cluster bacterium]|nr:CBS domain-containing protein [SAR324 cluster bacterium]
MLTIKDIMTKEIHSLHSTQSLYLARAMMKTQHIRHIPIVNADQEFVGLLSHRDLLALSVSQLAGIEETEQMELDQHTPIVSVMKTDIVTVSEDLDLSSAIAILLENKYGCLPVVNGENLVGIVTAADFLQLTLDLMQKTDQKHSE